MHVMWVSDEQEIGVSSCGVWWGCGIGKFDSNAAVMYCDACVDDRNDHTIMTAPLPVCSAKLSMIWPG